MNNLLALKCDCCGGNLKPTLGDPGKYVCEYCNTHYVKDGLANVIKVETFHNPVRTLKSRVEYPVEVMQFMGEQASEIAMRSLTRNLADSLAEYMRVETEIDPASRKCVITARVRLVEDNYLF